MSINLNLDETVFNHKRKETSIITKGKTVGEILDDGVEQLPSLENAIFDIKGDLSTGILIKVNGQFVLSNQLTVSVKDGDIVEVLKYDG
jgi:hypothetical protein